jgi:prolyl oligopeptidase
MKTDCESATQTRNITHVARLLLAICTILMFTLPIIGSDKTAYIYPDARISNTIDDYHGTIVADPYRWLEDPDSEETLKWIEAQNKLTQDFVNTPARKIFNDRYTERFSYTDYGVPKLKGGRYFFGMQSGLTNQPIYYMREAVDGDMTAILDPNTLSDDGTIAVTLTEYSENGKYIAYAISVCGSDGQTIRIRDIDNARDFDESLEWCRFSSIAWKHDNSGFFYNRYPDPATVAEEDRFYYSRVYWHRLGMPQSRDILIYEDNANKEFDFDPSVSEDGKYLILRVWHSSLEMNRVYYKEIDSDKGFIKLIDIPDAEYSFVNNIGNIFYFFTDKEAPRGRVVAIDINNPSYANWREIIPEQVDVLESAKMVNGSIIAKYLHDAHSQLKFYSTGGELTGQIELPALGAVYKINGGNKDRELFYEFTSYLYPNTIFRYDFKTGKNEIYFESDNSFNPEGFVTKQVFCTSRDGTKIPIFISHKEDIVLDGNNPVIVYGYGGFQNNEIPYFSNSKSLWMELGGVYADVVLRGGSEYGEEWHQAGMLEKKQNVFDDFIAAAEWLIENKYTNPFRLAIQGGSNGGLLVAVCMIQRPGLFGAVVSGAPVIDMLRYHKFTVGRFWTAEYGNAEEDPDHFKFMYAYSPLHNVVDGVTHPPTLVTVADTDDRVVPSHGKKFVATLQAADSGKNPILLRTETKAGHGKGKPKSKIIEEQSDIYAFLFKVLGMDIE